MELKFKWHHQDCLLSPCPMLPLHWLWRQVDSAKQWPLAVRGLCFMSLVDPMAIWTSVYLIPECLCHVTVASWLQHFCPFVYSLNMYWVSTLCQVLCKLLGIPQVRPLPSMKALFPRGLGGEESDKRRQLIALHTVCCNVNMVSARKKNNALCDISSNRIGVLISIMVDA